LKRITQSAATVSDMTLQIASAAEQQAVTADEISRTLARIHTLVTVSARPASARVIPATRCGSWHGCWKGRSSSSGFEGSLFEPVRRHWSRFNRLAVRC